MIAYPQCGCRGGADGNIGRIGPDMPKGFVLLTTMNAATQRIPARHVLKEAAFRAEVGRRVDEAAA